jgi:leucyl aminopeptidase
MHVELSAGEPSAIGADLVAAAAGPRAAELGAPERATADADPVAMVYTAGAPLAVVALQPGVDGLRTAAARAVRACRGGGTVAWALDASLPLSVEEQVHALAEGAVIGGYDGRRWRSGEPPRGVERLVICGVGEQLAPVAERAALVARWINTARELVDAPPNVISPGALAERAAALPQVTAETIDPFAAGLGALAAVGGSSPARPLLIVLRHEPADAPDAPRLGLIGKAVTFDTGGYFLKPQADIVRQKADMAGGAAVVAAMGAIAELGLPLRVLAVVPSCENMPSGRSYRPGDIVTALNGKTIEVTNTDAEGRLVLADALTYARREGATHVVDLATLTGAVVIALGDFYAGVMGNDDAWVGRILDAGRASGDHAWRLPLHDTYRRLYRSIFADMKNSSDLRQAGPVYAARFLQEFAGEGPWAHLDIAGTAHLDRTRGDYYTQKGATGYGVRLLAELASGLAGSAQDS